MILESQDSIEGNDSDVYEGEASSSVLNDFKQREQHLLL